MLKKKPHDFIKHRTTKQRSNTGGKSSRTDSSFHANLEKIESWMVILEKASCEQDEDAFRAIPYILTLIREMLNTTPNARPNARNVRDKLLEILATHTTIPDIHCGAHSHDFGPAGSSTSGSDRASSIASLRTMSTISSASDTDTIRLSTSSISRVNSIVNAYSDRMTLAGISEDDSASIRTVEPPPPTSYNPTPRLPPLVDPPASPTATRTPTSPRFAERPSSPPRQGSTQKKSWKGPFFRMP